MAEPGGTRDSRHRLRTLLPLVVLLAVAAWALYARRHDIATGLGKLSWQATVGSVVFGYLAIFAMLGGWIAAVRDGGVALPLRDGVRIYAVGQIGKYLPGSVWPVLTQAQLARRRGASPVRVGSGSLLALAVSVGVGMVFGGVLLPFSDKDAVHQLWWVPVVAIPALAVLHPRILNRLLAVASRVLRRGEMEFGYTLRGVLRSAAWCVLGNVLFGVHIFFLSQDLGASGFRGLALSICAYALASSIGVAIIFLPAGAGAREAVLTLVLAPVLTVSSALVVALVSRAVLVVVDISFGLSQMYGLHRWSASPVDGA